MAISLGTGAARATIKLDGATKNQYESNSINPDTDTESLVVVLFEHIKNNKNDVTSFNSVTFGTASRTFGTGTAMTVVLADGTNNLTGCAIAYLKTDATGTVQIDTVTQFQAIIIDVLQLKVVDQTTPVPTTATAMITSSTGHNIPLTTDNDNSWLVGLCAISADDTNPPSLGNGTELHRESTGSLLFSDVKGAASHRTIVTQGAETANFTWDGSTWNALVAIEVKAASTGADHAVLADDLESASEVSTPSVGQVHALTADDLEAAAEVSTPVVGQVHALLADDLESATEVSTPTAAVVGVAVNQSTPFGDLTLGGDGGFQLIDSEGDPLTGVTDDATGTAGGFTLSAGGMITPTTDGSLSGEDTKTIDFSSDQGSATATFSISAPGYHFRTKAELLSVITDGALAGGWTVTGRRDAYINDAGTTSFFTAKTYTAPVILTGETGFRFRNIIVARVKRLTVRGINFDASDGTFTGNHVFNITGNCDELIVEDCQIHAEFRDPLGDYSAAGAYTNPVGIMTVSGAGSDPLGITIQRCEIFDVNAGCALTWESGPGLVFQDNEIHHVYSDFMTISPNVNALANGATIQRNICSMSLALASDADNPHPDVLQITSKSSTLGLDFENLIVRQNFAFEQTEARGRGTQGLNSFGTMVLKDPIFAGNVMVISGSNHMTIVSADGGVFTHNTLVQWETDAFGGSAPRLNLTASGDVMVRSNLYEGTNNLAGSATYTELDNLSIGADGGTFAYSDVFDGTTFNPKTWTELKTKYPRADNDEADRTPFAATNIEDAGALGSGYQVVADVRDPAGWSFDSAYEVIGHNLLADDLESATEVSTPAVAQLQVLLADDLESVAEVSKPTALESTAVLADDLESAAEVTTPVVAQVHALLAADLESAAEVTAPAVAQLNVLLADDLESAAEVSKPTAAESNNLLADDLESAAEVTAPSMGQVHAVLGDDLEATTEVGSPSLAQLHGLLAADLESATELSKPTLEDLGLIIAADYFRTGVWDGPFQRNGAWHGSFKRTGTWK